MQATAPHHPEAVLCQSQTVPGNARITPGNKAQVVVVYAAILADIFVTAYTDTLRTTEVLAIILLLRCSTPLDQQPALICVGSVAHPLSYYCLVLCMTAACRSSCCLPSSWPSSC